MKLLPIVIVIAFAASSPAAEDLKEARAHWAYQPVSKPPVPAVKATPWVKSPVDAFILARLEANGMKPSPAASRETLLRRVSFDLVGLPPTTDELRAFLADNAPDAFTKVVDRLLASPHFGERWGRHWLDTARYSDTAGQVKAIVESYRYDGAWSYRDYVIAAFNDDKPYDEFILEQIAADKLPRGNDPTVLAALGFLTVGQRFLNKNDVINDRIDAVTKGFLGLTVACARCHDHKFDPIPTEDYYALHGIFNSSVEPVERPLITMVKDKALVADYQAKLRALEDKDRDLYFEAVGKINGDFRQNVAAMLLNGGSGGGARGGRPPEQNTPPANSRPGRTMQPPSDTPGDKPSGGGGGAPSDQNKTPAPGRATRALQTQGNPPGDGGAATRDGQPPEKATPPPGGRGGRTMQTLAPTDPGPRGTLEMKQSTSSVNGRGTVGDDKIAGAALQNLRADDPVWGPWLRFRQLAPADLATRGNAVADEIARGKWNAIIAAQFKGATPTSLAAVAAIYAAAFAKADAQAQKYLAAKRAAATAQVPGFDPALAELIEKPLPVLPGATLTTERLRDEIAHWPRGLRTAAPFVFESINELDISHPAAPRTPW